jgi:hypothetical protein
MSENITPINNTLTAVDKYRDGIYTVCLNIQNLLLDYEIKKVKFGDKNIQGEGLQLRCSIRILIIWILADLELEGIDSKKWIQITKTGSVDEVFDVYYDILRMLKRLNLISLNGPEVLL